MGARYKLSQAFIKSCSPGKYNDGAGLWLHKRAEGGGQWFFRYTFCGHRKETGLGGLNNVGLATARKKAEHARALIESDIDPINEKKRLKNEYAKSLNTIGMIASLAYEAKKAELKGDGKNGRWFSPLALHVLPKIGKMPIEQLDQHDIKTCISPIWHSKGETAKKALHRLNIVIKHAAAMGLDVDIGAVEKAKALLGQSKQQKKNIPAMLWADAPSFYQSLNETTQAGLALKLLMLTGVRSYPVRYAETQEFEEDMWVIPGAKMKGPSGKTPDFRVPLSEESKRVIYIAKQRTPNDFVFANLKGNILSDAGMSSIMKRAGIKARPHGFRSTLRTWIAETQNVSLEVAEMVLAHRPASKVVRAYERTDFLDQRREIMGKWAAYLLG
jgi:integrase